MIHPKLPQQMDKSVLQVVQGSRTYGSPSCVTRPAATLIQCMYAAKITEYCRRLGIKPLVTTRAAGVHCGPLHERI